MTAELVRAAVAAADAGAAAALRYRSGIGVSQWAKADGSRVTEADLAAEDAVRRRLASLMPGVPVLGEERGATGTGTDRWIVDPIDGTENFSRGNPVWATLVAFESAGSVTAAAITAPALRRRWSAGRGAGAFADDRPLRVSDRTDRADATFCTGGLHELPSDDALQRLVTTARSFRCAWGWGNFWGHVQVAEGSAEAALSHGVEVWDIAAPALLVAEAGGRATDVEGCHPPYGSLLTSNGRLHDDLLADLSGSHV